ncbi:hypothetical protein GUJ93_ZPchr0011g28219 [Zizania palustris]|uniref:GH18 domain-containing protein n=1 Tax=Zizania palustris TaxID=103762 RepID=A0A8J5WFB3_ZIZPA|nr:hypothetical protein GUJ93_ZPchr0011g28219 [Zizania palustris]
MYPQMSMEFRRRCSCALLPLAMACFLLLSGQSTAVRTGQVAVFWGRHKDEVSLKDACDAGLYTSVIISFYSVFGHGRYWVDLSGHPLHGVGSDIKHCQSKGISVLLSIGGQGDQYSLPSSRSAADVAYNLYNSFLDGRRKGVFRPFGDAVVDGIDFFIDQGSPDHYDELARKLFSYYQYEVLLTATTRCTYPDRLLEKALATGLFSHIHVRMFGGDELNCTATPRESWEKWAATYTGSLVYLTVVASPEQDEYAYMSPRTLNNTVLRFIEEKPNYGGLIIWDAFYDNHTGYSTRLQNFSAN